MNILRARRTPPDLRGRVALVVGARGGIGAAVTAALAAAGAEVLAADLPPAPPAPAGPGPGPGRVTQIAARAGDAAGAAALVDRVVAAHGRIDLLVHAAGRVSLEPFAERDPADVADELRLNLHSPLHLISAALPALRAGRLTGPHPTRRGIRRRRPPRAQVVVLCSLGGVIPMPGQAIYTASKFGLRGALLSLAMELRAEGVAVTSVLPGAVDTPMLAAEAAGGGNALQFLGAPAAPADVAERILGAVAAAIAGRPVAEVYPGRVEGLAARVAMLHPPVLPAALTLLEPLGRRGMARHRRRLRARQAPPAG